MSTRKKLVVVAGEGSNHVGVATEAISHVEMAIVATRSRGNSYSSYLITWK